jgi:predicted Rossmann-fold nucleotide-binding protein
MAFSIQSRPEIASARSLVIAAGGGRDLAWPHQRVAAELLARSSGRLVHLLLQGGARGADAAIARAAHQLGWCSMVMPAQWQQHGRAAGPIRNRELLQQAIARAVAHSSPGSMASVLVVAFPGGAGTASLVSQARRLAYRSPVPIAVVEVSPSAGLWAVPSPELPPVA